MKNYSSNNSKKKKKKIQTRNLRKLMSYQKLGIKTRHYSPLPLVMTGGGISVLSYHYGNKVIKSSSHLAILFSLIKHQIVLRTTCNLTYYSIIWWELEHGHVTTVIDNVSCSAEFLFLCWLNYFEVFMFYLQLYIEIYTLSVC